MENDAPEDLLPIFDYLKKKIMFFFEEEDEAFLHVIHQSFGISTKQP